MATRTGGVKTLLRLAGEAVAIFVGVGAALAGQAWFEGRAERLAEREYLERVLQDLVVVEGLAESLAQRDQQRRADLIQVAGMLARPNVAARADSLARLAPTLSEYVGPSLFSATALLLAPDNLRRVQDESLRSRMGDFALSVASLQTVLAQQMDFMFDEWRAFGIEYFDFRLAGAFADEPDYAPDSRHVRDGGRIAESPEFENLVDLSFMQDRNIRYNLRAVREAIPELRDLMADRLAAL